MKINLSVIALSLLAACAAVSVDEVSAQDKNPDDVIVSRYAGQTSKAPSTTKSNQITQAICEGTQATINIERLWSNEKDIETSIIVLSGGDKLSGRVPSDLNGDISEANSLNIISKCVNNDVEFTIHLNTLSEESLTSDERGSFIVNSKTSSFKFIE